MVSNSLNTFVLHQRPLSDVKLGEVFTALIHEVSNGQWLLLLSLLLIERMEAVVRQMRKCSAARAYATQAQILAIRDYYRGDQGLYEFARQGCVQPNASVKVTLTLLSLPAAVTFTAFATISLLI